jgi:asparagine synthase (glutamine-hydrolysing)
MCHTTFPQIGPLRRAAALFDYAAGGLDAFLARSDSASLYKSAGLLGERLSGMPVEADDYRSIDSSDGVLADFLNHERKNRFVGEYMTKVDGATMHYGLEARSPFLDHVLWEFASSLPFDLRLHRGCLKAILRELVKRRIGKDVANRRKRGFGVPVERWIISRWRPWVEAVLHQSVLDKEGWIHSRRVLDQLELYARQGWAPAQLWYIFVLESWLQHEQNITPQGSHASRVDII